MSNTCVGICYGDSSHLPIRSGAVLAVPEEDTLQVTVCPGRRFMYRAYVPGVEGVWAPACYANCRENELAALRLRTLGPTPSDPVEWPASVVEAFRSLRTLARRLAVERWSLERVAASYRGRLGRRYEEARLSLEQDGWLEAADFRLRAFLKGEKHNPRLKIGKPRMICPRSARYNLVLASYLKPLEHALWRNWRWALGVPATRVSGKGLGPGARADLIRRKMASVGDCVVFEVDGRAFEAHVTSKQLREEWSVYKAAYGGSVELAELLSVQGRLSGRTAGGVRFDREGCRASGDYNTGMGNTILMGCFVRAAIVDFSKQHPEVRATTLVDGDNALIFVDRDSAEALRANFGGLMSRVCSHEMTVEKPTSTLEGVVFGQSQPVLTSDGWKMVRNPWKVLSGAFCGHRHYHSPGFAPRLMREVAIAELSLAKGVPVLQAYFAACAQVLKTYKRVRDPQAFLEGALLGVVGDGGTSPVSHEARLSFERAFGICAEDQVTLERRLVEGVLSELGEVAASARWLKTVVEGPDGANASESRDDWDHLFLVD